MVSIVVPSTVSNKTIEFNVVSANNVSGPFSCLFTFNDDKDTDENDDDGGDESWMSDNWRV